MSGIAIANVLLRNRRIVFAIAIAFFVVALAFSLTAPRTYTSTASFAPAAQRSTSNLAGLAAQLGIQASGADQSQSPNFYADLIPSREIMRAIADSPFRLSSGGRQRVVSPAAWFGAGDEPTPLVQEKLTEKLRRAVSVKTSAVSGIVRIAVTTQDPEISREVATRTIKAVNTFNSRRRRQRTESEREFVESQLSEAYGRLRDAETRLLSFQLENRDYRSSPRLAFEAERLQRDVAGKQEIYTAIAQSYEQVRIDAIRDAPTITVFEEPNKPALPNGRGTISKSLTGLVLGALIGMLIAFTREYFSRSRSVYPSAAEEFQLLKRETLADLRFRRRRASADKP